ncbi:bifunctional protein FolD 2-like isoform X5 [Chenopodium quinoa]|uniref:bifunctional protein FolD 2-like isoform X5 n=1 Tax=Chenopodium quinoa TaxID=63459 RepID=UPI000B793534|nr:bifunctional protein FolD 2-like isoform X5 [Chenopodium quinoa]XP_021720855.1 bifunctional protein FolD 2-like isoform X5 [Chenopodium quinoa]
MRGDRVILKAVFNNTVFRAFSSSSIQSSHSNQFGRLKHLGFDLPDVWPSATFSQTSITPHSVDGPSAEIIDGKSIAAKIKSQVASEILKMKDAVGKQPGLAVVLVGERSDSHTFVRTKMKACDEVGISSSVIELLADCTEDEVFHVVSNLNKDPSIHGVLVQLPLPKHLDEEKILNVVNPEKDVDGFHSFNMGSLAMKGREPFFIPCAAKSCIDLLLRSGVEIAGKNAVVIGRSKLVGLPVSLLLQRHHATVSVVHSFTKNAQELTREAEIIITDVGVPNMIRGNWLRSGAVVIDAGTNAVKDPNRKNGFHVTGDVCFEEAVRVASAITPVPGGLGPVTISMLLSNTLDSAKHAYGFV